MASSFKNVSTLLSPKFLSPLSPSRNLVNLPASEGKMYFRQTNRNIAKKLDFTVETLKPNVSDMQIKFTGKNLDFTQGKLNFTSPVLRPKIPDIKIDLSEDVKCKLSSPKILDMSTPIKLDLAQNGLENFKKRTTVLGQGTFGIVFKGKHKGTFDQKRLNNQETRRIFAVALRIHKKTLMDLNQEIGMSITFPFKNFTGETVAVKLVTKETSSRERNALGLNHLNIVRTIEIITNSDHQNYSLIIMEYLPNCKTLQYVLDNFDTQDYHQVFAKQITSGLHYLHSHGIIHLDLKPKNILVDSENVCRICDFGNSIKAGEAFDNFTHNGTVMYTAPEILLGKTPTVKSDIYSLGLVLWQIWHRQNPFQEYETKESIIYNIGKHDVRPSFRKDTPGSLKTILKKCWSCNPETRPEAAEVLLKLVEVQF